MDTERRADGEPTTLLLGWYDRHRRRLPWRALPGERADPYRVWLSEVMLQQTTTAAVAPYFQRFTARWPRVEDLAAAPTEAVMAQWAGLGYYARARNLLACARAIVTNHAGRFPDTEAGLRALPGVGQYTAAAIAAIAFGRRAVVVDGNVERVASRLFRVESPLPAAKRLLYAHMDSLTPGRRAGDFAQAMMDLGATICTPKRPACALCPLNADCRAREAGDMEEFPRKAAKPERPLRRGAAFLVRRSDGALLVRTRPAKGLLGGMLEPPGSAWAAGDFPGPESAPLAAEWRSLGTATHVFTHFRLELAVFAATVPWATPAPAECVWLPAEDIAGAGWATVFRRVVELHPDVSPALESPQRTPSKSPPGGA